MFMVLPTLLLSKALLSALFFDPFVNWKCLWLQVQVL